MKMSDIFQSQQNNSNTQIEGLLIANRIPKNYFISKGRGESDITIHAGSYHLALKQAGIEMANIITYSSVLPAIATEIPKPQPQSIIHGSVMETIMSVSNVEKGERATAGIIYAWLYERKTRQKYGGLVCEHQGSFSEIQLKKNLRASLEELYMNGFEENFEIAETDIHYITESFIPTKKYGTALVSICFTNYIYPIVSD